MSEDPYISPQAPPISENWSEQENAEVSEAPSIVVEHLRCTRPWVKFCSLAGYVTSTFILVIAMITIQKLSGVIPPIYLLLLGAFYLILAVLFSIPSLRLSKYERSILRLVVTSRTEDLELAIAHQRVFWKQMAIMILMILVLYLITIALSAIMLLSGKISL